MTFINVPQGGAAGNIVPGLKFKANQGRLYLYDRVQDLNGVWSPQEIEITDSRPQFAMDFGRLEVGWCHFMQGMAPQYFMVPYGEPMPPKPGSPGNDDATGKALSFQQGFRIPVAGKALGGVREFTGNSKALLNGMNDLHSAFEAAPEAALGQIPIVTLTHNITVKTGQSTNFQPVFEIKSWVDRHEILGPRTVPPPRASVPLSRMSPQDVAAMAAASVPPTPAPQAKVPADEMPF